MVLGKIVGFNELIDENNLDVIQDIVFQIFSKKTKNDKDNWKKIRSLLLLSLKNGKVNLFKRSIFWIYVNRTIIKGIKKRETLLEIEKRLRKFTKRHTDEEKDLNPIEFECGKKNFEKLKNYIIGEKILDLGAGNGILALEIKEQLRKEVILVDVIDYNYTNLPLIVYNPNNKIPLLDKEVDTTILHTVLHHSNNPEFLLNEASRLTKRRLIIKEAYNDKDDARVSNSFFDWFYNRVIGGEDINIPLNFLKVKEWETTLKKCGFDIIESKYVGIDEPLIPEYHVYIVADKIDQ